VGVVDDDKYEFNLYNWLNSKRIINLEIFILAIKEIRLIINFWLKNLKILFYLTNIGFDLTDRIKALFADDKPNTFGCHCVSYLFSTILKDILKKLFFKK